MENRREDWHNLVDERLVNLNSAQGTTDIELAKIEEELAKLDRIIRGDPVERLDGLVETFKDHQKEINKFNKIFDKDYLGHGGLISFINYLVSEQEVRAKREGYRWTFWTAFLPVVVVQLLILIGLVVVNWDKINEYVLLHEHIHQAATIELNTKKLRAKRRKPKPLPVIQEPETEN